MVGEEKRHQMIQNLFGEQSEEEEEVESEHESNRQPDSSSDEGDGGPEPEGEDEAEVEGQGEAELESEGEPQNLHHPVHAESEDERDQSSQEIEIGDQREETEERYSESDEKDDYDQNNVTSRRREIVDSGSERSEDNLYAANVESKVNQARSPSRSSGDEKDEDQFLQSAPEIRDVFGDSDEEEAEYEVQNQVEDGNQSPMEDDEEQHDKELRPEDMIPDDDAPYYSEEEHIEAKSKEKPTGPPLELEIPLCNPPAEPNKMHMIKVSNIMGIDPKPFDPRTYVEEDYYVTDESGSKKRLRLENNVVRWRKVKNPDGTISVESNARFVEWSDGSLQLQIGNEVLNISKQDAQHEQSHLFLRHRKGILQSQGRILTKMRFMPSSLSSNSHRLLTALVDSRHKKVYRIKNCITNIDPEKEKEQKEKAASQSIRTSEHLSRKKQKVSRKYTQTTIRRERQLSPGFLEDDPYEEDDADYQDSRRSAVRRRFDQDMEQEARAEKRIINAKKATNKSAYPAAKPYRRPVEFSESEKEESEYETDGEEEASPYRRDEEPDRYADEDEELEQGEEEEPYDESEEEVQEPKQKIKTSGGGVKRKDMESDEDSPPRKTTTHRRMKMVYESDEE